MKTIVKFCVIILMMTSFSSCILEDVEPEYDVVGGVATVTTWIPSTTAPASGQSMTITATYYSEHAPVVELRFFARVGTAERVLLETIPVSNHNTSDSYSREFEYTVPVGLPPATVIVLTVEVETPKELSISRSTPATGAGTIRTI